MKQFLKDNFVLFVGIALPLVLVLLFFLAGQFSKQTVADPQYDAVFALDYYPNNVGNPYSISVDNGNIVIKKNEMDDKNQPHIQKPRLYIFDHKTLQTRALEINLDNLVNGVVLDHDLTALNEKTIIAGEVAPDGYRFDYHYRSGGGLFGELFGGYRYRSNYVLRKDNRTIPLEGPHSYYQAHIVGWVRP